MCERAAMSIRIGSTVINCSDLETMTRFWSQALDLTPNSAHPDDDYVVMTDPEGNEFCVCAMSE
jgi:predicted enzyme related to lactoylglutathione lyase